MGPRLGFLKNDAYVLPEAQTTSRRPCLLVSRALDSIGLLSFSVLEHTAFHVY